MNISAILGIDPDGAGAIAVLSTEGAILDIEDMPMDDVITNDKNRKRINELRLLGYLANMDGAHAFIERPQARPLPRRLNRQTGVWAVPMQSAGSMIEMGARFEAVRFACIVSKIAITEVAPASWKRAMNLPSDKAQCRRRAQEQFPLQAALFSRVKDAGRAESALIALWGQRYALNMNRGP